MELIHWHPSFSVGVQHIDIQHQTLFSLVNELISAINSGQRSEVMDRILPGVVAYTQTHFQTEEELFKSHPRSQAHVAAHHQFIERLQILARDLSVDRDNSGQALLDFLTQWLKNHILKIDITYFAELGHRLRESGLDLANRLQLLTQKEMILLVDDEPVHRRMVGKSLERDGFAVLEANNGAEALALLEQHLDVHLVITDLAMPVMDGFELIRSIRANPSQAIYLIVLSGVMEKESLIRAFSLGANDFLTKPVFHPELRLRIRNGLNLLQLESQDELIFALAKLADCRSPETGYHLERVRAFTRLLGGQLLSSGPDLGLTESMVAEISRFSPLHDIGKVAIADAILHKPARLTPEEFQIMQDHARIGGELIGRISRKTGSRSLHLAYELTMYHHEKWDGSGYPTALVGKSIPMAARIMALADVYDALTSERSYKKAFSREEARAIILEASGTHFDPDLVQAFTTVEPQFHQLRMELRDIDPLP